MIIALISDIHANIHALRVVLEDLDRECVDKVLVAGDLIGYYYWPREVVEILMHDERFLCIRGNHEDILKRTMSDDAAAQRYRQKYGSGYDFCIEQMSVIQLNWLLSLPAQLSVNLDGKRFYMSHGALGDTDKYLYPDSPMETLLENYAEAEYTIFGHTHYPFLHEHDGRYLLNPGSVGQPRDVGGLASYIVINTSNNVVRFKRKPFDIEPIVSFSIKNDPSLKYLSSIMDR